MVKKPRLFIALCTLPALILTIVFMIVPMVNAIYLSFTSSTALSVGYLLEGTVGMNHTESQTEMMLGKAAFITNGTWMENEMQDAPREDGFEFCNGSDPDRERRRCALCI